MRIIKTRCFNFKNKHNIPTSIKNQSNTFKNLSFGLSCLLAISESLALDKSVQSNGIIHAIKSLKDEIKELQ